MAVEQRHTRGVATVARNTASDAPGAENLNFAAAVKETNATSADPTATAFAALIAVGADHDATLRSAT
jgi:hypothetical protein